MTYVSCLSNPRGAPRHRGEQSETRNPTAECLAPDGREEEIGVWVLGTGEDSKALHRLEVQRGAQMVPAS